MWWRFRKHKLAMGGTVVLIAVLSGRAVRRLLRLCRSDGIGGAAIADGAAADPLVRRGKLQPVRVRVERNARPQHVQAGLRSRHEHEDTGHVLRPRRALPVAGLHPDRPPPDRGGGRQAERVAVPAGHRHAGTRPLVAAHVRHANVDDHRPGQRGAEPGAGRRPGRHLRLFRRRDRYGDPARSSRSCARFRRFPSGWAWPRRFPPTGASCRSTSPSRSSFR